MSVSTPIAPGTDIRSLFAEAYNNRYTWDPALPVTAAAAYGAKAINRWKAASTLAATSRPKSKASAMRRCTKLWHPSFGSLHPLVRRPFEVTHKDNQFMLATAPMKALRFSLAAKEKAINTASKTTW